MVEKRKEIPAKGETNRGTDGRTDMLRRLQKSAKEWREVFEELIKER